METNINKVAIRGFYEKHKDEYFRRRLSGDVKLWDEQYKWDILPELNKRLSIYEKITRDNIEGFISIINNNSNKSNFAHWIDMDDLKLLADLPYGNQILDIVWQANSEDVEEAIDTANDISNSFKPNKKFSPSTWGYILAAKDCGSFSIYRESILKQLIEINFVDKKGIAQGKKYQLLNDSALYLGSIMAAEKMDGISTDQNALNGQDFLWITLSQYN